jgi:glycosyltransferase involved in cell wall biosynthesis
MKTIVYIGGFELPDKNAAAQRVVNNAKLLRELGYKVVLIGFTKDEKASSEPKLIKSNAFGFDSYSMPYPKSTFDWFKQLYSISQILKVIQKTPSNSLAGIISYNYYSIAQYRLIKFCKKNGLFHISDATEWYNADGSNLLKKAIKFFDVYFRMHFVHKASTGILATSKFLNDFYSTTNNNVVELPTLFDCSEIQNGIESTAETIRIIYAGNPFNVFNAGRKNVKDRLDYIVELMFDINGINVEVFFDVYGLTKVQYLNVYPEHASMINKTNIIFHGRRDRSEIIIATQKADYSVFFREVDRVTESGFPTKFSESISYGTPVLTNKISNLDAYMKEGETGYFLDLESREKRAAKFKNILKLGKDNINKQKRICYESNIFDYNKFIPSMKSFFDKIVN